MTFSDFPKGGPRRGDRDRRGRDRRDQVEQGGFEQRRGRWEHGEHHKDPFEHRGRGRGFGPIPPVPPGFAGPGGGEFWGPGGFGGPHHRRGRGRAGRGDVRAAIVALLAEEPRNGYQIIQEIEQRTDGAWRASSGSVYPALAQLEDEGLIEPVGEGGRRLFTLTEAGRQHAEQNAEHLSRIWQDAVGGPGSRFEEFLRDRELLGQAAMAYKQVAQVGTPAQREQARQIVIKTRQALYKILATDEPAEGDTGNGEPRDAEPSN